MHVLITGHTGFKGAWLTLLLNRLGHEVSGFALDPEPQSLFHQARVHELLAVDTRADVRDITAVSQAFNHAEPDVVIHLAAQPLVRESYSKPRETIETNVMGTMNILETSSSLPNLQALLVITTDKVYRNVGRVAGYAEHEPLGGDDPYSASKAMADILSYSWATSFPGVPTAIARAGNVIGGGDYSRDRLVPDIIAAFQAGRPARLRYPQAVRPWQHVLDCLNGYLAIIDHMLQATDPTLRAQTWNIGPGSDSFKTVAELANLMSELWPAPSTWEVEEGDHPHEAHLLALDATRAGERLGWVNYLDFEVSVAWTTDWYKTIQKGRDPRDVTGDQIEAFLRASGVRKWPAEQSQPR